MRPSFGGALSGSAIVLPGAGIGTLESGPETVPAALPLQRARDGVATLELRVEARGGSPTGSGAPGFALERLRQCVEAYDCPLAIVRVGDVQVVGPKLLGAHVEPTAIWTCDVEVSTRVLESVARISRVADPAVVVVG